jgi:hypothetical protein
MHTFLIVTCALLVVVVVVCALLVVVVAVQIFNMGCGSNTVACRKHKGVVGWLCTKLEGSVGKLDLAIHKYYRMLFNRCT